MSRQNASIGRSCPAGVDCQADVLRLIQPAGIGDIQNIRGMIRHIFNLIMYIDYQLIIKSQGIILFV